MTITRTGSLNKHFFQNRGIHVECTLQPLLTALCPGIHSNLAVCVSTESQAPVTSVSQVRPCLRLLQGYTSSRQNLQYTKKADSVGTLAWAADLDLLPSSKESGTCSEHLSQLEPPKPKLPSAPPHSVDSFPVCFVLFLFYLKVRFHPWRATKLWALHIGRSEENKLTK